MVPVRDFEARIICSDTILKSSSLKTWHWPSHIKACVALILDGVRRYRHCCTDTNNCRDMEHHHSRCERLHLWVTIVNRVWFVAYARCWGLWQLISLWIAIRSESTPDVPRTSYDIFRIPCEICLLSTLRWSVQIEYEHFKMVITCFR